MYVDAKPAALYGETCGWQMPHQREPGRLRHPKMAPPAPMLASLPGMEQILPSFRSFVERIPPINEESHRAMPAATATETQSSAMQQSRSSSVDSRRSSSVYSRDTDGGSPSEASWNSTDLAEPNVLSNRRALPYSASTSCLREKPPVPMFLEPRTYTPPAKSPSPFTNHAKTPSPPKTFTIEPRPSILLPPSPPSVTLPRTHLRTVSLEAVHKSQNPLPTPDNLSISIKPRQNTARSKSQEPLRRDLRGPASATDLPETSTFVDQQGRDRVVHSYNPSASRIDSVTTRLEDVLIKSPSTSQVARGPLQVTILLSSRTRQQPKDKAAQTLRLCAADGSRGHSHDLQSHIVQDLHVSIGERRSPISDFEYKEVTEGRRIIMDYDTLSKEQHNQSDKPTMAPASFLQRVESDASIRSYTNMVPQPLFYGKTRPAHRSSSSIIEQCSADRCRSSSRHSSTPSDRSPFPLTISLKEKSSDRGSTSGSIPISPPPDVTFASQGQAESTQGDLQREPARHELDTNDPRVSRFYPHIMSRSKPSGKKEETKKPKEKEKQKHKAQKRISPSLLSPLTDVFSKRLRLSKESPERESESLSSVSKHSSVMRAIRPARPLNERQASSADDEPVGANGRSRLLGSLIEGWRENKAQRRREDLKKLIKHVPNVVDDNTEKRETLPGSRQTSAES